MPRPRRRPAPMRLRRRSGTGRKPSTTARRGRPARYGTVPQRPPPTNIQQVKFNSYIKKVLKKVKPKVKINSASVDIVDAIVKETLHKIASQASEKMGRRKVLKPKIIMRALKTIMPRALVEKADERGQRALTRYASKTRRR